MVLRGDNIKQMAFIGNDKFWVPGLKHNCYDLGIDLSRLLALSYLSMKKHMINLNEIFYIVPNLAHVQCLLKLSSSSWYNRSDMSVHVLVLSKLLNE